MLFKYFLTVVIIISPQCLFASDEPKLTKVKLEFRVNDGKTREKEFVIDIEKERKKFSEFYEQIVGNDSGEITATMHTKISKGVPDLKITHVSKVAQGESHGKSKMYTAGFLRRETDFSHNKLHGWAIDYWPNGKIQQKTNWDRGTTIGKRYYYYIHGQVACEIPYINGRIEGQISYWASDGTLLSKGQYKDGKPSNGEFIKDFNLFVRRVAAGPDVIIRKGIFEVVRYSDGKRIGNKYLDNDRTKIELEEWKSVFKEAAQIWNSGL